jgi:CRISPR/Cas system-associated exonuclease Cas4 (RecB family)
MENQKIIHVSDISQIAWCQIKAQALLQKRYQPLETENMTNGKELHKKLGYDNEIAYLFPFGEYTLQATPDLVMRNIVFELKTTNGNYPLNFLLATAHTQANLYAYLLNLPLYVIVVYNTQTQKTEYICEHCDSFRAQRDLALAYAFLKNIIKPIPTSELWKCRQCAYTQCPYRRK